MKHKYADAIVAWAYGEPVQYMYRDMDAIEWIDFSQNNKRTPNFDSLILEWRPKPKKKEGWLVIHHGNDGTGLYSADIYPVHPFNATLSDAVACVRIEFEEGEGL